MESFISLFIDVIIYVLLVQYILYDVMKWSVDKTHTFNTVHLVVFVIALAGTAAYYYL